MKSVFTVLVIIYSLLTFMGCGSKEMSKAKEYMDAHMYNEAISLLEIEIQANPKNVEAYYLAAQCYIELNNTHQAEEYFNKAILLDTDYRIKVGEYYYEKAFKLYTENEHYSAENNYNKAEKYNPEGREDFAQKLFDYATEISETATRANEVTSIYNIVTNIDKKFNEDIAEKCAKLASEVFEKGFYEQSFEYGEFSIKYDPGFINSLANLYLTYAKKLLEVPDKSNEATGYFDRSIELNSSSRVDIAKIYYDYSQKYEKQNNTELTLIFAEKCYNLDNNYEKYYKEIAIKYKPKVPMEGLVAYYPFNGNANDECGTGNNGNINGSLSWVLDRLGNQRAALHFDGSTTYVLLNYSPFTFGSPDEFSISLWCKFNYMPHGESTILWNGTLETGYFVWSIGTWNGEIAFGCTKQQIGSWSIYGTRLMDLLTSKWYHIVSVYQNGSIFFYVNGVLKSSGNYNNEYARTNSRRGALWPFSIGATYTGDREPWNYFNGVIDDVRIYNRGLSQEEVNSLSH
jgi:tetratricopeptide (TPR) repeat protein